MGTPTGNPDALDKLKKDLEKLQEAAKGMAGKNTPGSEAERQKLSESLSALSKQMQDMGLQLPQLDDAIKALAANQPDLVLKDLQDVTGGPGEDARHGQVASAASAAVREAGQGFGRAAQERPARTGAGDAAEDDFAIAIGQSRAGAAPEDACRKCPRRLIPAGNYGKVAEHLKNASKQMQAGNKPGAAQALAAAAKELGDLTQQMGDAQAVGGDARQPEPGFDVHRLGPVLGDAHRQQAGHRSKGGRPGGGVGTWADPDAQWDGQWSDHWDNSGVERPDQDPRGHTDRGEGELSDALRPTKVKGQFKPGGQMPSITLKGVSIKGQSKVAYEEAATAAQSDAQSALSQEKVPRAYQGAVKDYFDDLKK